MKRSIEGINGINFVDEEESKAKLKQKNMLNELLEVQKVCTFLGSYSFVNTNWGRLVRKVSHISRIGKGPNDFVSKKRKLQAAKQRRDNILGEILFLKQRRRYLLKSQSSNVKSERNISHLNNFNAESEVPEEERSNNGDDATVEAARPAFTSMFNSGCEVGNKDGLKLECMPKSYLIDDNRIVKKKPSWHGQVTLKV